MKNIKSLLGAAVLILFFLWLVASAMIGAAQNIVVNGDQWTDADQNGIGDKWQADPFSSGATDTAQHINSGYIWQTFSKQQPGVYRLSLMCGSIQPVNVWFGTLAGLDQQYIIMPTSWGENVVFVEPTKVFNSIHFSSPDWYIIDRVELFKVAGVQAVEVEVVGGNYIKEARCR